MLCFPQATKQLTNQRSAVITSIIERKELGPTCNVQPFDISIHASLPVAGIGVKGIVP